jgi:hypothetical protein
MPRGALPSWVESSSCSDEESSSAEEEENVSSSDERRNSDSADALAARLQRNRAIAADPGLSLVHTVTEQQLRYISGWGGPLLAKASHV